MGTDTVARGLAIRASGGVRYVYAQRDDVTAQVNGALDEVGEYGHVCIVGDGVISDTLVVQHDGQVLDGIGTLGVSGMSNKPMIQVLNCSYFDVGNGLFFDPAWAPKVTAIQVVGGVLGSVHLEGQRSEIALDFNCEDGKATQGSALNDAWVTMRSGIRGLLFRGGEGRHASNNRIHVLNWWGAESVASVGVDYVGYCDNNTLAGYLSLNSAESIGLAYNMDAPRSDTQVYENHWDGIVDATVGRTVAVLGNRTHGELGRYPSFVRLRVGGGKGAGIQLSADCDIVFIRSNFDGRIHGWSGTSVVAVSAGQMTPGFRASSGQVYDQKYIGLQAGQARQYAWSQLALPAEWRAFDIVADWGIGNSSGGYVSFDVNLNQLAPGQAPGAGSPYHAVARAAGEGELVSTVVASSIRRLADLCTVRLTRAGTDQTDTASGEMRLYMLRLVRSA